MDHHLNTVAVGIDFAKKTDFSAWCVIEHTAREIPGRPGETETVFTSRGLDRIEQGLMYPQIAAELVGIIEQAVSQRQKELDDLARVDLEWSETLPSSRRKRAEHLVSVVVDGTGVGTAAVDILRDALRDYACPVTAVSFVYGDSLNVRPGAREGTLGKSFLVSRLQALFQTGRIELRRDHPRAATMKQELLDFEIRVNDRANEQSGAFKVGSHDDMVVALGLATLFEPQRITSVRKNW